MGESHGQSIFLGGRGDSGSAPSHERSAIPLRRTENVWRDRGPSVVLRRTDGRSHDVLSLRVAKHSGSLVPERGCSRVLASGLVVAFGQKTAVYRLGGGRVPPSSSAGCHLYVQAAKAPELLDFVRIGSKVKGSSRAARLESQPPGRECDA